MRKYLYFLSADARHLQTRLERLRDKGLELERTEGFFSSWFQRTNRKDLCYLVIPCGGARHFPRGNDYERYGWELAGGFNGMAIFKSIPCSDPDERGLRQKLKQDGCLRPDHWTVPVLLVLVLVWTVQLLWVGQFSLKEWYLSYSDMGRVFVLGVSILLMTANLVTFRSYVSAWVHGLTPWVMTGSFLLLFLSTMLDQTANTLYFAGFVGLIGFACALTLWMRSRGLGLSLAGVCALVLCLGLLFPNVNRTDAGGKGLHNEVADQPVVQLTDLGVENALTGTGYETGGTFLARGIYYWEICDGATVSSQVYCCVTDSLAEDIVKHILATGNWEVADYGWSSREGKAVLFHQDAEVAMVTYSESLSEEQIEAIQAELFEAEE